MVTYDYIVYDEVECDPYTNICFIYCENEACEEPFYYAEMERPALNLMNYCNGDNIDCDAAYWCMEDEVDCVITFCEPENDNELCEDFDENDFYDDSNVFETTSDDIQTDLDVTNDESNQFES